MTTIAKLKNAKLLPNGSLMGQIYDDPRKRFPDGTTVMTSTIQKVQTRNTEYEVEFSE